MSGIIGQDFLPESLVSPLEAGKARGNCPLTILVDSEGGFLHSAVQIFNQIRSYPGRTTARITGLAASAASYCMLAADRVEAMANTSVFLHFPWILIAGDKNVLREEANTLEALGELMKLEYCAKSLKSPDEMEAILAAGTWYTGKHGLMESGLVDEVVQPVKVSALAVSSFDILDAARGRAVACARIVETGKQADVLRVKAMMANDDGREIIPGWSAGQVRRMGELGYDLDALKKYGGKK
jgi:ATP-dependent protease ClpP protease subunit